MTFRSPVTSTSALSAYSLNLRLLSELVMAATESGGGVHEAPPLPEDVWTISDALSHSPQWCRHQEVALAQVNNLQPMLLQVPLVKCRGPQK